MTHPGQYGSHTYQSPQTRALASITAESYDKDQAKTLIKLKNDVGYMAAYMRKMQKSIDQANENFLQQIQSFIADIIVLLGGGSLTSIDFGDLRYVLQAIGALLGFQSVGGIPIPINLFTAAWNFFGIYISPTQQFEDVINELIDAAISIILDALGEIPIIGESLQQLAAWLVEIRDLLWPLADTVFSLIDALSGQPGSSYDDALQGIFSQLGIQIDMDLSSPEAFIDSIIAAIEGAVDFVVDWAKNFVPAEAIIGNIPVESLGNISISNIGDFLANLIANPWFENLTDIDSSVYTWDQTQHHSPTGGSAKVTADGTGSKDLLSNLIPVTKDQTVNTSIWAKYTNLVGSGSPIQLGFTEYHYDQTTREYTAINQPNITTLGLTPPTSDWRQLTGQYKITNPNTNAVRQRLTVTPSATAGTLWWSDAYLTKSGLLPQLLVQGRTIGKTLADDITSITSDLAKAFDDILTKVAQGDYNSLLNILAPGGALPDIDARLKAFLNNLSPLNGSNINTGAIADAYLPGVRTTLDNIVTRLMGITGSGFSQTQSNNALWHIADVVAGLSSMVNRLQSTITAGVQVQDEFERQGSTLGVDWSTTYLQGSAGTVGCDGHNMVFNKSGLSPRVFVSRNVKIVTYDDWQVVRVSLDNGADNPLLSGLTGHPAYNDVLGRLSLDNLNMIRFRMGAGEAWVDRVVNGIEQNMFYTTYNTADPGPGSMLTLYCGDPAKSNKRYFEGRHNANTIIQGVETGTASMLGASYRSVGAGGKANDWPLFLTQSAPGKVRQFSGGDM